MITLLPSTTACSSSIIKKTLSAFALFWFLAPSFAADYYWVGNSGNWSDFAAHWATSSGGSTFYTTSPASGDNVFFDSNSFSLAGQVVSIDVNASCNNMDWTGVSNNPDLAGAMQLNISGSLTLAAAMTATYNGALYFLATDTGNTISFMGITYNGWGIYFQGSGDWTFQDSMIAPASTLYINNGTVYANGKTITINGFNNFSTFPKTFDLGASAINTGFWMVNMPGLTIIPGTSVLNVTNGSFSGGNLNYNVVNLISLSGSVNIMGSNNIDSLSVSGIVTSIFFENNSVQNVNFLSLPSGNCSGLVNMNSGSGSFATISMPSGLFTGDYLRINNIKATGGATFNANNSIPNGNTSGWNFTFPPTAPLYWIGGTGNWSDSSKWSFSSGGAPAFCLPNELTDVFFNGSSFPGFGQTVTINATAYCKSMNWTGATGFPTMAGSGNLNIYGSLTLINLMNTTATGGLNFLADSFGNTINTAGRTLQNSTATFDGNGTWTLNNSGLNCKLFNLSKGGFSTNNLALTITGFSSWTSAQRGMNLGSSTVNCNGNWSISDSTGFILLAGTSSLDVTGTSFSGGFKTYNNVTISNVGTVTVSGSNNFNQLTFNNTTSINFGGGTTNSANAFTFPAGTCSVYRTLKSVSAGTPATLSSPSGTVAVNFYNIQDMAGTGGATYNANNSFDNGNNSGWNFTSPTPKNFYWIGGTGNWSEGTHWSLTSGGPAANCVPTKYDNVFFDANSFGGGAKTVTINVDASCRSMDWTGINTANARILAGANTRSLNIWGSLIFNASANMQNNFQGTVYFKSDSLGRTIDLKGKTLNGSYTYFDGDGEWTLASAFTAQGIFHGKGSIVTNNFAVTSTSFSSSTSNIRQLSLGSSLVNINGNWQISNGAGYTVNPGTSTINISGTYYYGGNLTYRNVNFSAATTISFYGGNTYDTLTFSSSKDISFEGGKTQTFSLLSILSGTSCSELVKIKSLNPGMPANFSKASGTFNGNYLQITDVTAGGGATFNAANSYGIGDVTGWNISSPAVDDFYWIAGSGNWSDPNHWSLSSGGPPATCSPSILDNVFFDTNSFTGSGDTVTVDVASSCNNMDWTGAALNPNFAGFQSLNIGGSIKLISAMTLTYNGTMSFTSNLMGNNIDFAGNQSNISLSFNGSGGWTLMNPLTTASSFQINFNNGTLNTNGKNISMGFGSFSSNSAAARTLTLGNSVISTNNWDIANPTGITLNAGSSTISVANFGFQFRGGNLNYNVVNLGSMGGMQIWNSNSYDSLNIAPGTMIMLQDSEIQTVNVLSASGVPGDNTVFNSMTAGSQATLNITGGLYCGDYFTLKDIAGTGGPLYAGANSTDNGNNTGWLFSVCPTVLTNVMSSTNISCNGADDGTATVSPSAGTTPYTYLWSSGGTTPTITGLTPGLYIVTVTDAVASTDIDSVTITEPAAISLSTNQTDVTGCTGGNNGSVNLTVGGGTPAYSFSWSNGATTEDVTGLIAGNYIVTVTDVNGCTDTISATITEPPGMSLAFTQINDSCYGGSNGTATVSVINGYTPVKKTINVQNFNFNPSITNANVGDTIVWFRVNGTHTTTSTTIPVGAIAWDSPIDAGNTSFTYVVSIPGTYNYKCTPHEIMFMIGTINVSEPLSFLWSTGNTTQTVTGLSAGTYSVTVDNGSCTRTDSVTITQPSAISISSVITNVGCSGGNNGAIDLGVSGGVSPYTFFWNDSATTEDRSGLASATYNVTVTDANNCTKTTSATITQPAVLSASTASTDASCNGLCDGSIAVVPAGGTTPYSYVPFPLTNLCSGPYSITVTDGNGCVATANDTVSQPATLSLTISKSDASCNGGSDGDAMAMPAGGTSPYSYLWSNGQTTTTATGLSAGNYSVTATDTNGCTTAASVTILQPSALIASTTANNVNCTGGNDGTATVIVSGGNSGYSYLWDNGQTTQTATGLSPGNFIVTVTDANGCAVITGATINEPASPLSIIATSNNAGCNGGGDGNATASAAGGTSPYSYLWSDGQTDTIATGLSAGFIDVTVTDANGCTAGGNTTISEPSAINLSTVKSDVSCNGGNDGAASVSASGGTGGFIFLWSNGQTTAAATGLPAGNYDVTVTDVNACSATSSVNIAEPTAISVSFSTVGAACGNSDGTATVTSSGGNGTHTYLWINGQTTQTATGLTAGNYQISVTDSSGCQETATVSVSNIGGPTLILVSTDINCNGENNGAVNLTVSGGTTPYTYLWNNSATTEDISGLVAGTYDVTVTDGSTCVSAGVSTVNEPAALISTSVQTNVSCFGGNNGGVNLTVTGGTSPYSFLWSNSATTEDLSGVSAGTFFVTINDAKFCSITDTATVSQPVSALALSTAKTNVNCFGGNDGSINLTPSGGTSPYAFIWSNAATTEDLAGLVSGTYSVTVSDSNSCVATFTELITEPAGMATSAIAINVSCFGGNNGSVNLTVTGGAAPYLYLWSNAETTQDLTGITAGVYHVTVTDSNSCTRSDSATISEPSALNISSVQTDVNCNGASDGTIDVTAGGGTAGYSYLWSNASTTEDLSGLTAGTYSVTATDANSCTATASATVSQPAAVSLSATLTDVNCNSGNDGAIILTASGGITPYAYLWSNGATSDSISGLVSGNYSVTVTDNNACSETTTSTITEPPALSVVTSTVDASCGNADGSASASPSGGVSPYYYLWSNGATSDTLTGVSAGSYSVTVTDSNGCPLSETISVNNIGGPAISISSNNVLCNGGSNGSATANASGGISPYTYLWSSGQSTKTAIALSAGNYTVTVTDNNGCLSSSVVIISQPAAIAIIFTTAPVSCYGGNDGSASSTVSGGITPYSFLWSNGGTASQISNLSPQSYSLSVTDNNGCSSVDSAIVEEPAIVSVTVATVDVSCYGGNDGSASAIVSGGTPPYSFLWDDGQTGDTASALSAGLYYLTAADSNGCLTDSVSATISEPPILSASSFSNDASCGNSDGMATASATGGTSPYTYLWNNGQATPVSTGLFAGVYYVTATDTNGCYAISSTSVNNVGGPVVTAVSGNITCNGGNDGTATASASGGNPPYTYLWNDNGSQTGQTATGLSAGNFIVQVADNNGCIGTATTTIVDPAVIVLSVSSTDVTCSGNNGTATVNTSGGVGSFIYLWSDGQTTAMATGLVAGSYYITATDSGGCSAVGVATVNSIGGISINISGSGILCSGSCDGTATVNATGGGTPYNYFWSTGSNNATISNLCAGAYSVTVADANMCTDSATITFAQNTPVSLTVSTTVDSGNATGTATVVANGGISPYQYLWTGGQNTATATGLPTGNYWITVTDANGCTGIDSAYVPQFFGVSQMANLKSQIAIYPNPAGDEIFLQLELSTSEKVKVILINSLGQETLLSNQRSESGKNSLKIDLTIIPSGVYFLAVYPGNGHPQHLRFTKEN